MCIGLSSVDHLPFIPTSECSKSDDTSTQMNFPYDSFVKEEIIDVNDEDDDKNENYCDKANTSIEEPAIIQHSQLLPSPTRTVFISPKQSKGPIAISKHLAKPVFIPINLSNVKTIKVKKFFFTSLNQNF